MHMRSGEIATIGIAVVACVVYLGKGLMQNMQNNPKYSDRFKSNIKKIFTAILIVCLFLIYLFRHISISSINK